MTSATNTPSIPRPDHCPKVETVSCSDNTAVVTGVIGGVVGLHDYSHPVSGDDSSVYTTRGRDGKSKVGGRCSLSG